MAAIDEVAPPGHTAEAFTWVGAVYGAGSALGAALSGQLIAGGGSGGAFIAAALAAGATVLVTGARRGTLARSAAEVRSAAEDRPAAEDQPAAPDDQLTAR
jgi:hypothetical protein